MDEWSYERDLQLDFIATPCRSGGQGRNLFESVFEVLCGFNQSRSRLRPFCCLPPEADSLLG